MFRVFIGVDSRQVLAASVLEHSIHSTAKKPVFVSRIYYKHTNIQRKGASEFTFNRYMVPRICNYEGVSLFLDADMLLLSDINDLFSEFNPTYAVQVVKSSMRFEWPSVMLFNCSKCKKLTEDYIMKGTPQDFSWADSVGDLQKEWNHLVGYDQPNGHEKLLHYTAGIPYYQEVHGLGFESEWFAAKNNMLSANSWIEISGQTVHSQKVINLINKKVSEWKSL